MDRRLKTALIAAAVLFLAAAAVLAVLGHDTLAWRSALARGDRQLADRPASAGWRADTWAPRSSSSSLLGLTQGLVDRRAIRAFAVAEHTGVGFDDGATRDSVRSAAEVELSTAAARGPAGPASQASNLLGVLVAAGGRVVGGVTADDRAQEAFEAAVRRDPTNASAKYNLELLLRRTAARATRQGQGNGTGSLGHGRRGAGAGTPGRGY